MQETPSRYVPERNTSEDQVGSYRLDSSAWKLLPSHGSALGRASRIGRVLVATGADATDVAITIPFGPAMLERFYGMKLWQMSVISSP